MVPFYVVNHGKLPADAHIRSAVAYSRTRMASVEGLGGVREKHRFIFSETAGDALVALGREALTAGQLADIQNGIGYIYLAVEVDYGNYYTRFARSSPSRPPERRCRARRFRRGLVRTRYAPIPSPTTPIEPALAALPRDLSRRSSASLSPEGEGASEAASSVRVRASESPRY